VLFLRLYDAEAAKDPVWKEVQSGVQVKHGLFAANLGAEEKGLAVLFAGGPALWLGIQVGSDPELPRVRLGTVPSAHFAFVAAAGAFPWAAAKTPGGAALGLDCSGCVGSTMIADGAIGATKVAFTFAGSSEKGGAASEALHAKAADSALLAAQASKAITATTADEANSAAKAAALACTGCIGPGHIAAGAVGSEQIADAKVTLAKLAADVKTGFLSTQGGAVSGPVALTAGLDLGGSKLSNAALAAVEVAKDPCTAKEIGRLGVDAKTARLHFCDGTKWRRITTCDGTCPAAGLVACGQPVLDSCGDAACGTTGTQCALGTCDGQVCVCAGGSQQAPAPSCKAILQCSPGAQSGVYWLRLADGAKLEQGYCDLTTDGGGWLLLYAYKHTANQSANLDSTKLPTSPAAGYSHRLLKDLGAANTWAKDLRFYCETNAHSRKMHFRTSNAKLLQTAWDGKSYAGAGDWQSGWQALGGHNANLPAGTDSVWASGETAGFTEFPFYRGGTWHWGLNGSGNRWECDDYPGGPGYATLHQVWVR
jgi:hypothetical protein